ncbi:hypothetical protein [Methylobacterium nodulans]|uniref:Uncharacterized protein n=1 Tax=Methylobacterium nodulans (strain LMG 21967 / CNCM I-2342 / ORS 2060) TaxID=460265 RepID=B8IT70_METNO|nr:hypothetical protein [Methylobacterium nodulans]ACL56956.1 hypothetical protein Mnod_1968 [Methylobacterium nodulans ORS 2060]
MSGLTRFGTFPAPYGAAVPVYRAPTPDPSDPEAFVFDMQGVACALLSGLQPGPADVFAYLFPASAGPVRPKAESDPTRFVVTEVGLRALRDLPQDGRPWFG